MLLSLIEDKLRQNDWVRQSHYFDSDGDQVLRVVCLYGVSVQFLKCRNSGEVTACWFTEDDSGAWHPIVSAYKALVYAHNAVTDNAPVTCYFCGDSSATESDAISGVSTCFECEYEVVHSPYAV